MYESVVCFIDKNTDKEHLFIVEGDWREFRDVEIDMNDSLSTLMGELYSKLFINARQDFNIAKFPQISQADASEYIEQGAFLVICSRNKRQSLD